MQSLLDSLTEIHKYKNQEYESALSLWRVRDVGSLNVRKRGEGMRFCRRFGHNVLYPHPTHQQRITYQRSVTAPRHRFSTHDRQITVLPPADQILNSGRKFCSLHIVGIPSKRCVTPSTVQTVLRSVSQPTKSFDMPIGNILSSNTRRKIWAVELRVVSGLRNRAHIHEFLHSVCLQHLNKLVNGMSRVADRIDGDTGVVSHASIVLQCQCLLRSKFLHKHVFFTIESSHESIAKIR